MIQLKCKIIKYLFKYIFIILILLNNLNSEQIQQEKENKDNNNNNSPVQTNCIDSDPKCSLWASQGECQTNAIWMMTNCRQSCQSCQGGDRAWQLRSEITKNYDNSSSTNATRIVSIESVRIQHMEIDENKEQARVFGRLVLSWNDSKVSWDRESWGLSWLNFYWVQVWTPQLLQINAPNPSPGQITGKVLAANYTGQIFMWTDFNFVAPFNFEYQDFPKDRQRICYQFDDKRYFAVKFIVSEEVKNRQHESIQDAHVSGWDIELLDISDSKYTVQILGDWRQNPFDIQTNNCELCIELTRSSVYYFTEMVCPALVSSILTLSSVFFQLSLGQPAILCFSILCQLLGLQLLNARLPSYTGTVPTICIYYKLILIINSFFFFKVKYTSFNLLISSFLFLSTIMLRRISQANSNIPLPRFIYTLSSYLDKCIPLPKGGKDLLEENNNKNTSLGNYSEIALTLNNSLFSAAIFIYIFAFIFSFIL
ncbi:ShKT domain-containing protein [Meloidogyne graminicola]|uniref:ShKT domain-containing protein n=1 Tax=Meloidogyne graminicola TaxID=189291 RepID=A0A8S9ZX06_9BILA|nr:ShKT domain-containing protein [Meloidogyne graminicola]